MLPVPPITSLPPSLLTFLSFSLVAALTLSSSLSVIPPTSRSRNHAFRTYVVRVRSLPLRSHGEKRISRSIRPISADILVHVPPWGKEARLRCSKRSSPPSPWQKVSDAFFQFDPDVCVYDKERERYMWSMRKYIYVINSMYSNLSSGTRTRREGTRWTEALRGYVDEEIRSRMMCRCRNGW